MAWVLDERELTRLSYLFASLNVSPQLGPTFIKNMRELGVGPNLEAALQKLEAALLQPDLESAVEALELDGSRVAHEVALLLNQELRVNGELSKK